MTREGAQTATGCAFIAPERFLDALEPSSVIRFLTSAADLVFVLDSDGIIVDVQLMMPSLDCGGIHDELIGRRWVDTVEPDSREKVQRFINDAGGTTTRAREINQRLPGDETVTFSFLIAPIGEDGLYLAIGRDMSPVTSLQQSLVSAQLNLEREYARLRQIEQRYRLLFQISSEATLVVDAGAEKVIDANPAAERLLGKENDDGLAGKALATLVHAKSVGALSSLLARSAATGKPVDGHFLLRGNGKTATLRASAFREGTKLFYLIRAIPPDEESDLPLPKSLLETAALSMWEHMPDGMVIVDHERRILAANAAFLAHCEVPSDAQVVGQPLDLFIGRPGVDVSILIRHLNENGAIRHFSTICRGRLGGTVDVDVAAVMEKLGDKARYGFAVRERPRHRIPGNDNRNAAVPKGMEHFTSLVGRVPLKELVRESTDLIEKRCIEAALHVTGGNRASASEMLGLSRQSLYVKLRRYGIGEDDQDG